MVHVSAEAGRHQATVVDRGVVAGFRRDAFLARGSDHDNGNTYETFGILPFWKRMGTQTGDMGKDH